MEKTHKMLPFTQIMMMVFIITITAQNVGATWKDMVEAKIKVVSGEDKSEKVEGLVLEKFRVLLGLRSLHRKIKPDNAGWGNGAPAPSPSQFDCEAEPPALAPASMSGVYLHKHHHHHHHRWPHPRPMLPLRKLNGKHKEKRKRKIIIIAVTLSSGMLLVIIPLGVFLITRRLNQCKKVAIRTASVCSEEGRNRDRSKTTTALELASKVHYDSSFDMFHLNSPTTAIEQEEACFKGACDSFNMTSVGNIDSASQEINSLGHEATQTGPRETSSPVEEIISVHEYAESSKNESDDNNSSNGDKIRVIDPHSSEDESFHSFYDSRSSSNLRLSNVSLGSYGDPAEVFSPNQSYRSPASPINLPPNSPQNTYNQAQPANSSTDEPHYPHDNIQSQTSLPPPPPPPPPPPSQRSILRTSLSCPSSSTHSTSKDSYSSTMLHTLYPRKSQSSSGSNESPGEGLTSSSLTHLTGPLNIAPAPCPPPFLYGNTKAVKGPPPPPGYPPPVMQLGKDGNPLPKLKPLHWDKVRATPDRSMVWDQLRCSSFELDEETIESLFGYSLKTAANNEEGKSKTPSPSKHVLEPKRLQNITILSKALNVTAEKVCEALIQGEGLCSQQLEALVKMAPTKEEEGKLSNYSGEITELGSAEKLVKEMLTIPYAFERIEAMLYRATFDDEVVHLRNSFSMLEEACSELRSSRLFLKLLEAVLKTGNRMNVGTIRGGARAFKLDALLKLSDVKGTDGKTTLLHFVVQEIIRSEGIRMSDSIMGHIDRSSKNRTMEEKEDDYRRMGLDLVSGLSTELCNVKRTASIDLDVLATSVTNLSDGISKLQKLLRKDLLATSDNFVIAMKTFLSHAECNLKGLQAEEQKVLLSIREITEYYHGDLNKEEASPLRIFVIVRDFLGMLDQVCKELKTLKTPKSPNPLAPFQ